MAKGDKPKRVHIRGVVTRVSRTSDGALVSDVCATIRDENNNFYDVHTTFESEREEDKRDRQVNPMALVLERRLRKYEGTDTPIGVRAVPTSFSKGSLREKGAGVHHSKPVYEFPEEEP